MTAARRGPLRVQVEAAGQERLVTVEPARLEGLRR